MIRIMVNSCSLVHRSFGERQMHPCMGKGGDRQGLCRGMGCVWRTSVMWGNGSGRRYRSLSALLALGADVVRMALRYRGQFHAHDVQLADLGLFEKSATTSANFMSGEYDTNRFSGAIPLLVK